MAYRSLWLIGEVAKLAVLAAALFTALIIVVPQ